MQKMLQSNTLYYGDNLSILREYVAEESIDFAYLEPPFNSSATYNILLRAPTGEAGQAQIEAFEDTWYWNAATEQAFDDVIGSGNSNAAEMLRAMRSFLRENDMMAYLANICARIQIGTVEQLFSRQALFKYRGRTLRSSRELNVRHPRPNRK